MSSLSQSKSICYIGWSPMKPQIINLTITCLLMQICKVYDWSSLAMILRVFARQSFPSLLVAYGFMIKITSIGIMPYTSLQTDMRRVNYILTCLGLLPIAWDRYLSKLPVYSLLQARDDLQVHWRWPSSAIQFIHPINSDKNKQESDSHISLEMRLWPTADSYTFFQGAFY